MKVESFSGIWIFRPNPTLLEKSDPDPDPQSCLPHSKFKISKQCIHAREKKCIHAAVENTKSLNVKYLQLTSYIIIKS